MTTKHLNRSAWGLVAVLTVLVSSCGTPESSTARQSFAAEESQPVQIELGSTCVNGTFDRANAAFYFGVVIHVERFQSDDVVSAAQMGELVDDSTVDVSDLTFAPNRSTLRSDVSPLIEGTRLLLGPQLVADSTRLPKGTPTWVAFGPSHRENEAWVQFVTLVDDETGDLQFVGECARRFFGTPLTDYRNEMRPTDRLDDVFLSLVSDESVLADFSDWILGEGAYSRPSFSELSPQERQLDAESTPPDFLAALQPFALELEIPAAWTGIERAALCSFVPSGWNECVALEALGEKDPLTLLGFSDPGGPIELWLIDTLERGTRSPLAKIGELQLTTRDPGVVVTQATISGGSGLSMTGLTEDIESGLVRLDVLAETS